MSQLLAALLGALATAIVAKIFDQFEEGVIVKFLNGVTKSDLNDLVTSSQLAEEIERLEKLIPPTSTAQKIHIERGKVKFHDLRGPDVQGSDKHIKANRLPYEYKSIPYNGHTFSNRPQVIVGLSKIDLNNNVHNGDRTPINTRLEVVLQHSDGKTNAIGKESFMLKAATWADSYVFEIEVNWIAYEVLQSRLQ